MRRPRPALLPLALAGLALLAGCAAPPAGQAGPLGASPELGFRPWEARSLGSAQDAGMPHLGCARPNCERARRDGLRAHVASFLVSTDEDWYLVDATPDLPAQIHAVGTMPAGILLTHAHVGHYTGLVHLGREGMNAQGLPVHCSAPMAEFLAQNAPWSQLVELGNIELRPFAPAGYGEPVHLQVDPALSVQAIRVPHRDEYADTHGYLFRAAYGAHRVLYLPDIDRWDAAAYIPAALPGQSLVIDGSFWADGELGSRDMSGIPHPRVVASMERFAPYLELERSEVVFTHLNHTNPLWDPDSEQARELRARGFQCTWPHGWSTSLLPRGDAPAAAD